MTVARRTPWLSETGDVTGSEGDATLNADATPGGPTDDNGETAVTTGGATGSTDGITDTTTTVVTDATGGTTDVTGTPGSTENNGGDPQEGEAAKGTEGEGGDVVTDTPDPPPSTHGIGRAGRTASS